MPHLSLSDLKSSPPDARQYKRLPVKLTVTVWSIPNSPADASDTESLIIPRTAFIENLSLNGLFFVSPQAFDIGELVGIKMRLGAKTYQLEAITRRCGKHMTAGNCFYGCGVQFVQSAEMGTVIPAIASYLLQCPVP